MKTWEMLKELTENPKKNKIFEAKNKFGDRYQMLRDGAGYFELTVFNTDGKSISSDVPAGGFNGNIHQDYNWKEVPQEVTWQEAVQAWANGGKVSCRLDDWTYTYEGNVEYPFKGLEDSDGDGISAEEILQGKWYIL